MQKTNNPQVKITFTKRLYDHVQIRATELGTTKADYIRQLVLEDLRAEEEAKLQKDGTKNRSKSGGDKKVIIVKNDRTRRDKRLDRGDSRIRFDDLMKMLG